MDRRTVSNLLVERLYAPSNGGQGELGYPGEIPYTRGIHPLMYRQRLWTMRQFAGYGTPQETNRRFRFLLEQGQTGLSVAFDLPTLMGYDSDSPAAEGEVGKCGVAISSLADMEELFDGIPLGEVTTSMTITSSAAILWAMYLVVAERQGAAWESLSGTVQNDILKEFMAQKEYIYPPRPSMRLVADSIEFATRSTPRFNPISISGYHIREAGATAVQELAYTLGAAVAYVEWTLRRGFAVDEFAPRLSFFFDSHNDFLEEIAKFRAARRIWCKIMQERFGAANPRSLKLRFHAQTAGVTLTAQQPQVNLVRTALQALAAVLGGAQSLHTNALDEAYALPTSEAALLALRTQQVIASETGVTETVDPFGGSYCVERMTDELEAGCWKELDRIDAMGGMVKAVERGHPQAEIARSSYEHQRRIESGDLRIVGVNAHKESQEEPIETLAVDEEAGRRQRARLADLRRRRDSGAVDAALAEVRRAAAGTENLMPPILAAVRAYATLGEICDALRGEFGVYSEATAI
ncbi:MAG: methylmalonyl-CoA mutase family protein [Bryobacterales bacterium]|nr:methylmalonyl-CoA mutase family protein [Bryobacterales bacterium]